MQENAIRTYQNSANQTQTASLSDQAYKDSLFAQITPKNFGAFCTTLNQISLNIPSHSTYLAQIKTAQLPERVSQVFPKASDFLKEYPGHVMRVKSASSFLQKVPVTEILEAATQPKKAGRHIIESFLRALSLNPNAGQSVFLPEHLTNLKETADILDHESTGRGEAHLQNAYNTISTQVQNEGFAVLKNEFTEKPRPGYELPKTNKKAIQKAFDLALDETQPYHKEARIFLNSMAATSQISHHFPGLNGLTILKQLSRELDSEAGFFAKAYNSHLKTLSKEEVDQGLADSSYTDFHSDLNQCK